MSRKSGSAIGRYEIGTQARPQTELVRSTLRLFVCLFCPWKMEAEKRLCCNDIFSSRSSK